MIPTSLLPLSLSLPLLFSLAHAGPYSLTTLIPWSPLPSRFIDGSTIHNGTYYLSDLNNGVVHVIDVSTATETALIHGFVGPNKIRETSGPSGLVVVADKGELWVADGNGTVKIVDMGRNEIVGVVDLGIGMRADELSYDLREKVIAVAAPDIEVPTLFFLSVVSRSIVGKIEMPTATEGIEFPISNEQDGYWYVSVPSSVANPGGEIAVVDPKTFHLVRTMLEPTCNSAGISFGAPHSHVLFLGCSTGLDSYIVKTLNGKIDSTIKNVVGTDQVAYSKELNYFFATAFRNQDANGTWTPELVVINADGGHVIQRIVTDNVTAHAVAVDEVSKRVIVPLVGGIAVYDYHKHQKF